MEMPIWAVLKGVALRTVLLADLEILEETEQELREMRNKEQRIRNEKGRRFITDCKVFMIVT